MCTVTLQHCYVCKGQVILIRIFIGSALQCLGEGGGGGGGGGGGVAGCTDIQACLEVLCMSLYSWL